MKFNKKLWIQIHTYLSIFFLPAALLYIITGIGAIVGFESDSGGKTQDFILQTTPQKGQEEAFILDFLKQQNLKIPNPTTLQKFNSCFMYMGSPTYSVTLIKELEPNGDEHYKIHTSQRGLYGLAFFMHIAFQAPYFSVIAFGFSLSMIVFYFSGLVMTSFARGKRKIMLYVFVGAIFAVCLATYLSIRAI